jgi:drug/metabolite transporter (DMT)-like permease
MTRLLRDAVGTAPRELILVDLACAVLCVAGAGLLGAAALHALAEAAGPQVARLSLGAVAIVLAGLVWAVGAIRARRRQRRAAEARAQLAEEARAAALTRANLSGPVAAFVLAFLAGRTHR